VFQVGIACRLGRRDAREERVVAVSSMTTGNSIYSTQGEDRACRTTSED
jgi:hypothetical protein